MAKISASVRELRRAALAQGRFSIEGLADELNGRKFTRWWYDDEKEGQDIFVLACGVKVICYKTTGSVLVQGRIPESIKLSCMEHLQQMLPPYTTWQVN